MDINFWHRVTDLPACKIIITVLTFGDISKFSSVNTKIKLLSLLPKSSEKSLPKVDTMSHFFCPTMEGGLAISFVRP